MNGEMHQICMLVSAARNAITKGKEFTYLADRYVRSVSFRFLPQKTLFPKSLSVAHSPLEWYDGCIKKGINDIKFLAPLQVSDRALLGFANLSSAWMVTFHKDGAVTYWIADWEFDRSAQKWNVEYQEYQWDNPPMGKPRFTDNTAEFADILLRIGELADQIECEKFGDIFRSAYDILNGKKEIPERYANGTSVSPPDAPAENRRLFYAASVADVFGAMGSWNDAAPICAHRKGLDDAYESLSNELLKQIRLAALYAVNEG